MTKQQINRFVMVVGLLLVGFGQTAFGQNQPTVYSMDSYVSQVSSNQCSSAGEPVALSGKLHAEMTFTTDSSGVNQFSIVVSNDLNGIGQNSGLAYKAQDSNSYIINTSDAGGDISVEFRSGLNPSGGGTPMTLIQMLNLIVNSSGTVGIEVTDNSTRCGA